jgi:preprotein translocase subunit SecA
MFKFLFNPLNKYKKMVALVNVLESEMKLLDDQQLKYRSHQLKDLAQAGESLDGLLPTAFALTREAARRTLGQRHFDVQLIGGAVLHEGRIAEMTTGEGKTLVATAPAYLNALKGEGVHIVTVNDYLAKRDTVWMGQVYHFLGLKTACLVHEVAYMYDPDWHVQKEGATLIDKERDITGGFLIQQEFLRPIARQEAYRADIVYGTNHEFGFDYLRDNLVYDLEQPVQRGFAFAIIDEVDSILIDEARTPLIISAPDNESSSQYKSFARVVNRLERDIDYVVDEKRKSVDINDSGIDKVEKVFGISDLFSSDNLRLTHYLQESLRAKELFLRDRDYVVKDGEIIIVDQFTGRLMHGRRYSGGLHQAIEAREGV